MRRAPLSVLALLVVVGGCVADPSGSGPAIQRTTTSPTVSPAPSTPAVSATATPLAVSTGGTGGAYLAVGDSITFGIGVRRPQTQGYVARVADALSTGAPTVTETRVFAIPGETAGGFLERRLDAVIRAVSDLGPRVELVTIGLGANELLRTRRTPACVEDRGGVACAALVDAAVTEAAEALDRIVASILDALADAGSEARVLLLAYYNPDPDPLADASVAGADGVVACDDAAEPGLDDRIACIAEARGVELVNLYAAFRGRELELTRFARGDVHPNAAGYAVIAETVLEVLSIGSPEADGSNKRSHRLE